MKRFKLHGKSANWINGLRMSALNLRTLAEETSTPIPNGNRMYVSVANGVVHVDDARREILTHDVSEEDKGAILSAIKGNTPDFLLTLEDKVVGYANLCDRNGKRTESDSDNDVIDLDIDIDDIVDNDSLALLIIPATDTEPAHKKDEPKKDTTYVVTQTITIEVEERIDAKDKDDALDMASDLLSKAEDFLYEHYGNSHFDVTTRTYNYNTEIEVLE